MNQEFRFPGPGGVAWTHRVKTFGLQARISEHERLQIPEGEQKHVAEHRAREQATAIGMALLREASTHHVEEENGAITHRYAFSVVMPDANQNYFDNQIQAERRYARNDALDEAEKALLVLKAEMERRGEPSAVKMAVQRSINAVQQLPRRNEKGATAS